MPATRQEEKLHGDYYLKKCLCCEFIITILAKKLLINVSDK